MAAWTPRGRLYALGQELGFPQLLYDHVGHGVPCGAEGWQGFCRSADQHQLRFARAAAERQAERAET